MRFKPQFGILEFLIGMVCIALVLVAYLQRTQVEVTSILRVPFSASQAVHEKNKATVADALVSQQSKSTTLSQLPDAVKPAASRLLETLSVEYSGNSELRVAVTGRDRQECIDVLNAHLEINVASIKAPVIIIQTGIAPSSNTRAYIQVVAACWIGVILLLVFFGRSILRRLFSRKPAIQPAG